MTALAGVAHATTIAVEWPAEIAVGEAFSVSVTLSCPAGCDLSSVPIAVTAPDGVVAVSEPAAGSGSDEPHHIALNAPLRTGEHVWRLSCAAHETNGRYHAAVTVSMPVCALPVETSLAVWAIPSPVAVRQPFAIKVGAKSAAGCDLTGGRIELRDEAGSVLAKAALGPTPWPGTSALYWTELAVIAPTEPGLFSWSISFAAADLAIPHRDALSRFSIAIVAPPEHRLVVKVVDRDTTAPIPQAWVRLGAFRARSTETGIAELMVPKGSYDVAVWKPGYEAPTVGITVDADCAVEVAVTALAEDNPDAAWQM